MPPLCLDRRGDGPGLSEPASRPATRAAGGPSWLTFPAVTVAEPGRAFAFNRSGPGIGSYTWRNDLQPTATGRRLTESFDVERPLPKAMAWLTAKWVGRSDGDADLHEGMQVTLSRIKQAAEAH